MVGLCGVFGDQNQDVDRFCESFYYHGNEENATYTDDCLSVGYVNHNANFSRQPLELKDSDILLWIHGVVIGHEYKDEYTPRPPQLSDEEYYTELYNRYGSNFISGLNSEFAGVIYDRVEETISIFTDRLSTRPIYYTRADDGSFVFSTQILSLESHPHITLEYDTEFLSEFINYGRSLGTYTPIKSVRQLPPASMTTIDLKGDIVDEWIYWWPSLRPVDQSYSKFVSRFETAMTAAVKDRVEDAQKCGLLLSAGDDSRAILSTLDTDVVGFHMNEKLDGDSEALAAKKVADEAGIGFELLERDQNYYPSILNDTRELTNFNGIFRHANAAGFDQEISDAVDCLFCGQYSDTLIDLSTYVPMDGDKPQKIRSPAKYAESFDKGGMGGLIGEKPKNISYIKNTDDSKSVVERYVADKGTYIESHGVKYPSWDSLVQFGMAYPISNVRTFVFYETNVQMVPTHYPYFDNRILDLILEMPNHIRYQTEIVGDMVSNTAPNLAALRTNPRPTRIRRYLNHIRKTPVTQLPIDALKHIGVLEGPVERPSPPSQTHIKNGPWTDHDGLIRSHPFVERKLDEHEESLRQIPFLDSDAARECYSEHLDGEDQSDELYALLTLLEASVFIEPTPKLAKE